jgi:bifunctional lysine-specific demethylase and histidyl-hydroxylase NO66
VTTAATPPTRRTPATTPSETALGAGAAQLTLAPVGLDAFAAEYADRRPLLVERGEPGRFDGVLSTAEAERLVCATGLRTPAFRLVRDGAQLPPAGYTESIPWRPGAFTGIASVPRVAAEFAAGATLVLQGLHHHHLPSARYCRGLEAALGYPVQANAYWTPPGAQGFAVHHDTHDVFVLQVAGRKRWRVYEPVLELPLKDQRWAGGDAGAPVMDFVLGPGDTLYLPRGWPHEAETSGEASLHITVGLHPPTRMDALRAALDACGDDVEFRRAAGSVPGELLDRLGERLDVTALLRRRFVMSRRPVMPDQLSQVTAEVARDTPLRRRETVIADLEGATLFFEGREVAFPDVAHDALAHLHDSAGELTVRELPGPLDEPGRLVLARRLVREGYLRVSSSSAASSSSDL